MFIFIFIDRNHALGNAVVESMLSPSLVARRKFRQDPVEQIYLHFVPLSPLIHVGLGMRM